MITLSVRFNPESDKSYEVWAKESPRDSDGEIIYHTGQWIKKVKEFEDPKEASELVRKSFGMDIVLSD